LGNKFGVDVFDGLGVVGFAAMAYGVAQWSAPAAWIFGGLGLVVLALWPMHRKAKR
jgi:hypothetical protein